MGQYVDILGHPTWVDDDGADRPPLLMLHGGLLGSDASWGVLPSLLAPHFRLIKFDRRGHGRSRDVPRPFHYAEMADETAAVIEALGIGPARVIGYSDGANLLFYLGLDRPELIREMVLISANFRADAIEPEAIATLERLADGENMAARAYAAVSPEGPAYWPVALRKTIDMASTEPAFQPEQLSSITAPTLILASDDELWPTSHTAALYDALPNAQLTVVANTSHMLVFEQPELVAGTVLRFFGAASRARTILPTRRRRAHDSNNGDS
jgi:pimeloyl-ACP methyl ester carboxylesterase